MTYPYSQQALKSISDAISEEFHQFMQYGGFVKTAPTSLYDDLLTIADEDFIKILGRGVGEEQGDFFGFTTLEGAYQPENHLIVVSAVETASYILTLVYANSKDPEYHSGYIIYVETK